MKTTKKGIFSFAFVAEFIHFKKEVLPALQTILHRIGPLISIFAHSSAHTKPHFRNLYGLKKFSSLNTQSTKGDFFLELPLPLPHWASQGGYSLAHIKAASCISHCRCIQTDFIRVMDREGGQVPSNNSYSENAKKS